MGKEKESDGWMEAMKEGRGLRRKGKRVLTLGLLHLGDKQTDSSSNTGIFCASHVLGPYLKYVSQTLTFIQSRVRIYVLKDIETDCGQA